MCGHSLISIPCVHLSFAQQTPAGLLHSPIELKSCKLDTWSFNSSQLAQNIIRILLLLMCTKLGGHIRIKPLQKAKSMNMIKLQQCSQQATC